MMLRLKDGSETLNSSGLGLVMKGRVNDFWIHFQNDEVVKNESIAMAVHDNVC